MGDFKPHDYLFKVVLCGDSGVGKSNILGRYTKGEFLENVPTTIGVEFTTKATTYEGKSLAIQIWDTAGQERFNAIAKSYYRGAVGAFIVYDICKRATLESVEKRWLSQLKQHTHPSIVLCLLGNKSDNRDGRQVTYDEGKAVAERNNLMFFEVSAKDATNVSKAFEQMIIEIYTLVRKPTDGEPTQKEASRAGVRPEPYTPVSADSPLAQPQSSSPSVVLKDTSTSPPPSADGCAC
eukprot:Unigene5223_Nuclearia_a/m.16036 Unigene5223_Nuclearia_a/g.16036  ORF Unigene5223_Nuclearia_a/g.16036 Unigene5223_Nuclearia_a/m.16036 type:complete len:237 (-) Unigene5223_Nuclearia_a:135-845(-)